MARLPTKEEIQAADKALEPYKLALGRVAHQWNHMQERLGLLFCMVAGLDNSMGMGIWHSLKSDRTQRDLLEAATSAADKEEEWRNDFPKAKADIDWILRKVKALADSRNSAIHAPISAVIGGEPEIRPFTFFGNPNAAKLVGKDIFVEFEWYGNYFKTITKFAADLSLALMGRRRPNSVWMPWPNRPQLPTVGQKSSHQDRNHPPAQESPISPAAIISGVISISPSESSVSDRAGLSANS